MTSHNFAKTFSDKDSMDLWFDVVTSEETVLSPY